MPERKEKQEMFLKNGWLRLSYSHRPFQITTDVMLYLETNSWLIQAQRHLLTHNKTTSLLLNLHVCWSKRSFRNDPLFQSFTLS